MLIGGEESLIESDEGQKVTHWFKFGPLSVFQAEFRDAPAFKSTSLIDKWTL